MDGPRPLQPKRWKMCVVAWLAIYPLITGLQLLAGEPLAAIEPLPLRTLVVTLVVVPVMVYVAIPGFQRLLRPWLMR